MDKIVLELLQKNNIKSISKAELELQISSHPSYPSLYAITDVLTHFEIENLALDVPQNEEVYSQLPQYFIAQIKTDLSEELVFVEKNDVHIKIKYSDTKIEKIDKVAFLKKWTGIIVAIDENEFVANSITNNSKLLNYIPIFLLIGVLIFSFLYFSTLSLYTLVHLILSIAGLYVSTLIIKHEFGINSKIVDHICTSNKNTSCDDVLNSNAATLFGLFKLSDISFVYFFSLAITGICFNLIGFGKSTLVMLSLLSIPVVLFSIIYQGFIVKKWCPLCLAIASVLVFQFLISYFFNSLILSFEISSFLILVASLLIGIILYSKIKPIIRSKEKLAKTKIEYYKFKRKFSLFNSLYSQQPELDMAINTINEITFGNQNAAIELVIITNPQCAFCIDPHKAIDKLLKNYKDNLKVTIRFNIDVENKDMVSYKISNALLNLYQVDKAICKEAMDQMYTKDVNIKKWLKKYAKYTMSSQHQILEVQKQWCTKNKINFTPAKYLNGKAYPKEYELSDLSFFMDDLLEELNE